MTIEQRVANLEKMVIALMKNIDNDKFYTMADIDGINNTNGLHEKRLRVNTSDISDNREAIVETYESGLVNADDIADVRTALEEVYEMVNSEE